VHSPANAADARTQVNGFTASVVKRQTASAPKTGLEVAQLLTETLELSEKMLEPGSKRLADEV
jgi:hypothetical protein